MSRIILVPHDGYEMSDKALKYATEIARGLNMNIKLLRVVEEVLYISTMSHWNNIERARVKRGVEKDRIFHDAKSRYFLQLDELGQEDMIWHRHDPRNRC